jgi:hypothetical protein
MFYGGAREGVDDRESGNNIKQAVEKILRDGIGRSSLCVWPSGLISCLKRTMGKKKP